MTARDGRVEARDPQANTPDPRPSWYWRWYLCAECGRPGCPPVARRIHPEDASLLECGHAREEG
jgi:hypothetical protein